ILYLLRSYTVYAMSKLTETLSNQIHLRNIISCISDIEDMVDRESFESFDSDEEVRMPIYRSLMMLGIETSNIERSNFVRQLDMTALLSMKYADFINKLGKDHYAIYNFIKNDLPFFKCSIQKYLLSLSQLEHSSRPKEFLA
ncbi:MAG: hypothetical protein AAFN93_29170, partial [Bacteroidota bacterium]